MVVSGIEKAVSNPAAAAAMSGTAGLDLSKLPAGTDPFALLKRLPPLTRYRMLKTIDEKFSAMGSGTVVQGAAATVLAEYTGPRRGHGAPAGRATCCAPAASCCC